MKPFRRLNLSPPDGFSGAMTWGIEIDTQSAPQHWAAAGPIDREQ